MLAMKIDSTFLQTLANIFDNLSAGWIGAALIVPVFSEQPLNLNFWILIVNLFFGMVFMFLAYKIRKFKKVKKK